METGVWAQPPHPGRHARLAARGRRDRRIGPNCQQSRRYLPHGSVVSSAEREGHRRRRL